MLYESDVIASVCKYLKRNGHKIEQNLKETEKGDDIISIDANGVKCFIEAKGETSSNNRTSRYGKPFSSSQVGVHVAEAFFRAAEMKQRYSEPCKVGIALPDTDIHNKKIEKINKSLKQLSIEVFLVNSNGKAKALGFWR